MKGKDKKGKTDKKAKTTKEDKKSNAGAPTKYKAEFAAQAYNYTLLGATDEFLAQCFGVCEKTISNWKDSNPEFLQAVTRGKTIADAEVAASFRKRAVGYQYEETTVEERKGKLIVTKIVTKEMPPDTGAGLNWLKNRQPKLWRDKQHLEHTGADGQSIIPNYTIQLGMPKEIGEKEDG